MITIEVDFEVYKALTVRRPTEETTYNNVLRDLLGMGQLSHSEAVAEGGEVGAWHVKGIAFPVGAEFRVTYKGDLYSGTVRKGGLVVDGKTFTTPSAAAHYITHTNVNGWRFWECRFPGHTEWRDISTLLG